MSTLAAVGQSSCHSTTWITGSIDPPSHLDLTEPMIALVFRPTSRSLFKNPSALVLGIAKSSPPEVCASANKMRSSRGTSGSTTAPPASALCKLFNVPPGTHCSSLARSCASGSRGTLDAWIVAPSDGSAFVSLRGRFFARSSSPLPWWSSASGGVNISRR